MSGVWLSIIVGETLSMLMSIYFFQSTELFGEVMSNEICIDIKCKKRCKNADMADGLASRSAEGLADDKLDEELNDWLQQEVEK